MATLTYNFSKIQKRFNVYEKTQAKFAGKVALTKLGREFRGKNGLIAQTYLGRHGFKKFKSPVFFTLNSTFARQRELELDVGVKDERAITKGNPASKYLYPPIGGGSTRAYATQFTQYLRNRNLMNKGDYPIAATSHPLVRLNKYGNVTQGTYGATKKALGKTRDAKGREGFAGGNSKIGDRRVFAIKNTGTSRNKNLKKGIYRETGKSGLRALFYFGSTPTQPPQKTFRQRVKYFSDKKVIKYWSKEIKKLAK